MSTTKEKIEIMQAFEDGKTVECRGESSGIWGKVAVPNPLWNWPDCEYRIKPEPIECWVNVLDADICSTVFQSQKDAIMALRHIQNPERWTTRKFREVIE